jgi:hypothetical protein
VTVSTRRLSASAVLVLVGCVALGLVATATGDPTSETTTLEALTDVDAVPANVRSDIAAIESEIADRVSDWTAAVDVAALTESELAQAILTLWKAMVLVGADSAASDPRWSDVPPDDWWLAYRELGARLHVLCVRLPPEHELRRDFCA